MAHVYYFVQPVVVFEAVTTILLNALWEAQRVVPPGALPAPTHYSYAVAEYPF